MREVSLLFRKRWWQRKVVEVALAIPPQFLEQILSRIWENFSFASQKHSFLCTKDDMGDWIISFFLPRNKQTDLVDFLTVVCQQGALSFEAMELL